MRWHIGQPDELKDAIVKSKTEWTAHEEDSISAISENKQEWKFDCLFNDKISQNLEYNIFNYNFLKFFRSEKGALTYYLFHRASGTVTLSDDDSWLFLKETVDSTTAESSYNPVSDNDINGMVNSLNQLDEHFRKEGFDEVYFSLIPNPASMVQPRGYNNMIPRIQQHENLKASLIDYYDQVVATPRRYFRPGDNHWNNEGINLWLKSVNNNLVHVCHDTAHH